MQVPMDVALRTMLVSGIKMRWPIYHGHVTIIKQEHRRLDLTEITQHQTIPVSTLDCKSTSYWDGTFEPEVIRS